MNRDTDVACVGGNGGDIDGHDLSVGILVVLLHRFVSRHKGILLSVLIKSIKTTSIFESLDSGGLWLQGGGTWCLILLLLPCDPSVEGMCIFRTLQINHVGEILLIRR